MAAALAYRAATRADTARILDLVRLSLGEGVIPRDPAYWKWKHHLNPFGESPMLLAEADGRIVGLRAFMRWEWRHEGKTLRAVRAVDTATHPDWQGQGIFSRLTRALVQTMADEGVHFIFNTPNDKSRPGYLRMGWSAVGRVDLWIRPSRPLRLLTAVTRRIAGQRPAQVAQPVTDGPFESVDSLISHPDLPLFLENTEQRRAGLATLRTPEYLRWRYGMIPGFQYGALFNINGAVGAAVIGRYKDQGPLRELRICELLQGSTPASARIAGALLARLHRASPADYVSAMAPMRSTAPLTLIRRGYLPALRLGPILTVRQLNPIGADIDLLSRAHWELAIGDLELF